MGTWKGQTNTSTTFEGFYLRDIPVNSSFNRDALVGVYVAPKSFDFTQYSSFKAFVEENTDLKKLSGNSRNDKWFGDNDTAVEDPDYKWYADNNNLNGIIFPKGYKLDDGDALFIVLRTTPASALSASTVYTNKLYTGSGTDTPVPVNTAVYWTKGALHKESKGAYTYDADTNTITNCSTFQIVTNPNSPDYWVPDSLDWNFIRKNGGSGTYAPFLLNVNWNGTMEGDAEVSDFLPEGMELVYCDILWRGNAVADNLPRCEMMPELDASEEWIRFEKSSSYGNAISYYNPTTREIHWNISNLTKNAGEPQYKGYEIVLRIVCKVTDHDVLLNRNSKTFDNRVSTDDELDSASVTIDRGGSLTKEIVNVSYEDNGEINSDQNKLPFRIQINPFGEDLSDSDFLPPLIDELSPSMVVLEDSLTVKDADDNLVRGYLFTV